MSSPTPPTNGATVALIGRITTTILAKGEVANVIWSPFYTQYVATGYAAVYSGPITPTPVFRSFSDAAVADLIGSPTAATRLALDALFGGGGGGPVSNEAVAAIVAATGATKTALDARYAPLSLKADTIHYDASGNVDYVVQFGVRTDYTYNTDGTVATEVSQGLRKTWTYDANANPISSTVAAV